MHACMQGVVCKEFLAGALASRLVDSERFRFPEGWATAHTPPIKVVCPPERKLSAWIGGSIVGSLNATVRNAVN